MKSIFKVWLLGSLSLMACRPSVQSHYPAVKWEAGKKLQFLTFGLPSPGKQANASHVVAAKWGFENHNITGCIISKRLVDSINNHNTQVFNLLNARYGKNWQQRFANEVKQEFAAEKKVSALLDQQSRNADKRKQLEKTGNDLHYAIEPLNMPNVFNVKALGWGTINKRGEYVCYYKYLVDLNKSEVKMLSDTVTRI